MPAEASIVLVGINSRPHQDLVRSAHLFADLPPSMIDPAFLDRIHYYLPGWEAPKLETQLFTNHFGFVSDYFAEALRQLRKQSYMRAIDAQFALGAHLSARDEKAVRKWTFRNGLGLKGHCASAGWEPSSGSFGIRGGHVGLERW